MEAVQAATNLTVTAGTDLVFSTFLGDDGGPATIRGLALSESGDVSVAGSTQSSEFPVTSGAWDETFTGQASDGFVTRFDPTGSSLLYSTFLGGGGGGTSVTGVVVDNTGVTTVVGLTTSIGYPTTGAAFFHDSQGTAAFDPGFFPFNEGCSWT